MQLSERARRLCDAYRTYDMTAFSRLLRDDVFWGDPAYPDDPFACRNREDVLTRYRELLAEGARASVVDVFESDDAVVLGVLMECAPRRPEVAGRVRYQIFFFDKDRIGRILGADDREAAETLMRGQAV